MIPQVDTGITESSPDLPAVTVGRYTCNLIPTVGTKVTFQSKTSRHCLL